MTIQSDSQIFIARMPDVWGYGYTAFSHVSRQDAVKKIKECYQATHLDVHGKEHPNFEERWEYYGGWVDALDMDKVYDENVC